MFSLKRCLANYQERAQVRKENQNNEERIVQRIVPASLLVIQPSRFLQYETISTQVLLEACDGISRKNVESHVISPESLSRHISRKCEKSRNLT